MSVKSRTLATTSVSNLADLAKMLQHFNNGVLHTVGNEYVHVFGRDGEPLRLRVIVDTLTDGSEVYNINIE